MRSLFVAEDLNRQNHKIFDQRLQLDEAYSESANLRQQLRRGPKIYRKKYHHDLFRDGLSTINHNDHPSIECPVRTHDPPAADRESCASSI